MCQLIHTHCKTVRETASTPTVACFTVGIRGPGKFSTGPVYAIGRARTGAHVYNSCSPDLATKSIVSNAKSGLIGKKT